MFLIQEKIKGVVDVNGFMISSWVVTYSLILRRQLRRIEGREKSASGRILGSSMQDNQSKLTQYGTDAISSHVVH